MGLGKKMLLGGIAAIGAVHAHQLPACELHQAPKPAAEVVRKTIRLIPLDRIRIERRDSTAYTQPSPTTRRFILQ